MGNTAYFLAWSPPAASRVLPSLPPHSMAFQPCWSHTDPRRAFAKPETFPVTQILIRNRATDLDARMHDGTTPLILAARLAVEGMLEDLINSHADVNAVDDLGKPGCSSACGGQAAATRSAPADPLPPAQASLPCTGPPP